MNLKRSNYPVVTLCGSTRFKDKFLEVKKLLTLNGYIVLMPDMFSHADGIEVSKDLAHRLDLMHLQKIDMADSIYVINVDKYIGESTRKEIDYARSSGKEIMFLEETL